MTPSQRIVDALLSGNQDDPELPLEPSIDVTPAIVKEIASKAIKQYMDSRQHGKPVFDYRVDEHGIMYSDYFSGVSTYHTPYDDVYTGIGENAHEAMEDALENAAMDGWDVRSIKNEFDPNSEDTVQNSIRANNPDMSEDDAADGVYYYVSVYVQGIPEGGVQESEEIMKRLAQVAFDVGRKKFEVGQTIVRGTGATEEMMESFLEALESVDRPKYHEVLSNYSDEIEAGKRVQSGQGTDEDQQVVDEFVMETLDRIMQEYCPPITYFGSHPGDSSDIGCWPNYDLLREAEDEGGGDLLVVLDPNSLEATWVRAGQSPLTNKYAAWHNRNDPDAWDVYEVKTGKWLWTY